MNSLTSALDGSGRTCKITTKADNIPWLTEIPDSWQVVRSLSLFSVGTERAREEDEHLSATQLYGVIPLAEYERLAGRQIVKTILHQERRRHVERDDFVISMRSFQGGLERVWQSGSVRSSYVVLRPSSRVHVGFFAHLFKSEKFIQALRATSNFIRDGQDLNLANFKLVDLPLLPPAQQHQIAKYLDRKTAAIDALIDKKRKLVELLAEKRAALINQAVTKGLDPTVPMKDSGIPWIGGIPAHWEVKSLRRVLIKIDQGWSPQCDSFPVTGDEWGVLKSGCTADGRFRPDENKTLPPGLNPRPSLQIRQGDVLVCRASGSPAIIGSAAIVPPITQHLMLSDKVFRLGIVPRLANARFLVRALGSLGARTQIENMISGAEGLANNLPQSRLKDLVLSIPPLEEQIAIARALDDALGLLEKANEAVFSQISRLQEYRQALITAAVTGQLDIPPAEQP